MNIFRKGARQNTREICVNYGLSYSLGLPVTSVAASRVLGESLADPSRSLAFLADLPGLGPTFLIRMSPGKLGCPGESMSPGESTYCELSYRSACVVN